MQMWRSQQLLGHACIQKIANVTLKGHGVRLSVMDALYVLAKTALLRLWLHL